MSGINLRNLARALNNADTIITPRLTTFLIQHGDEPFPDWVVERIADLLRTKPRNRAGSFSASSAGGCVRAQELGFLGLDQSPIDAQLQNIFNDGKWRHLRWQATLLAAGLLAEVEYPIPWPAKRSMGSLDGVGEVAADHAHASWRGKEFGFELKGISTFQFGKVKSEGPLLKHRRQVHRYFLSGGFDMFVIIYEDKTTQAWCEWVVEPDPELMAGSRRELGMLNVAVDKQVLHPMLPECRKRNGLTWHECSFGGKVGTCGKVTSWPRLRKP